MSNYARAFRVVRAFHGWNQQGAAERIGVSASALSLIENGKRQPSIDLIDRLAIASCASLPLIAILASDDEAVDALKFLAVPVEGALRAAPAHVDELPIG